MNKIIFLTIVILLLSACTPSQQVDETSTDQSAQEKFTPTLPPAYSDILANNGFHQTRNYCTTICTSYELYEPHIIAKVYNNGSFTIQTDANNSGVLDLQVINIVLTQEYGQELTDWVTANLTAALRKEQVGEIGNNDITMSGKATERFMISVTPKK